MTGNLILGIDPGFTGSVAVIDAAGTSLRGIVDMPLKREIGAKDRSVIDAEKLKYEIEALTHEISFAVIEKVTASPQMGVTSAFRFGEGYGILVGVLAALEIKTVHVIPSVWKLAFGLSRDKKASVLKAIDLFPGSEKWFTRVKDHGRAEAALIAYYGAKHFGLPAPIMGSSFFDSIL